MWPASPTLVLMVRTVISYTRIDRRGGRLLLLPQLQYQLPFLLPMVPEDEPLLSPAYLTCLDYHGPLVWCSQNSFLPPGNLFRIRLAQSRGCHGIPVWANSEAMGQLRLLESVSPTLPPTATICSDRCSLSMPLFVLRSAWHRWWHAINLENHRI